MQFNESLLIEKEKIIALQKGANFKAVLTIILACTIANFIYSLINTSNIISIYVMSKTFCNTNVILWIIIYVCWLFCSLKFSIFGRVARKSVILLVYLLLLLVT